MKKVDIYSEAAIKAAAEHCRANGKQSVCIAQDWYKGEPAGVEYSKPPMGGRHGMVEVWKSGNAKCLWSRQHYSPDKGWHEATKLDEPRPSLLQWG